MTLRFAKAGTVKLKAVKAGRRPVAGQVAARQDRPVRTAARIAALAGALALPATAQAAPRADVMVVGKAKVLQAPRSVALKARSLRVGGHRCAVAGALAAVGAARHRAQLGVRDYGELLEPRRRRLRALRRAHRPRRGARAQRLGLQGRARHGERRRRAGPFGTRLRGGAALLWFWCRTGSAGGCQRTLDGQARGDAASRPARRCA